MTTDPKKLRRPDLRRTVERQMQRYHRRETGHASFWRSLGVLGSIGWPIVLFTAGGALLGHWLDVRWSTGVRLTLILVLIGATLGGAMAWHAVGGTRR